MSKSVVCDAVIVGLSRFGSVGLLNAEIFVVKQGTVEPRCWGGRAPDLLLHPDRLNGPGAERSSGWQRKAQKRQER